MAQDPVVQISLTIERIDDVAVFILREGVNG